MDTQEWWQPRPDDNINHNNRLAMKPHRNQTVSFQTVLDVSVVVVENFNFNQHSSYQERLLRTQENVLVILLNKAANQLRWYCNCDKDHAPEAKRSGRKWAQKGGTIYVTERVIQSILQSSYD